MKVAIVLTGHLRCWEMVLPSFQQCCIDRYDPDIFIHTWADEGWWVPVEGATGVHPDSTPLNIPAVKDAYRPISMVVEEFEPFLPIFGKRAETFPNFYHRPRNIISMCYKMGMGMHLLERHIMMTGTHYDLVIRMRPDLMFHMHLPEFDPAVFYTMWHRNHMGGGTGDMMQVGSFDNVRAFCQIGSALEALYAQTGLLCPHVMSVQQISNLGLLWAEINGPKTIQHTPRGEYQTV
jgi:hypothetical protein